MGGRSADGRGPSAMPLVLLGAVSGAAFGWLAFARAAEPLRSGLIGHAPVAQLDPNRAFYRPDEFSEEAADADP